MYEIHMHQRFEVSPARVFAEITDHAAFGKWLNANITVEKPGNPPPNGLGAVRRISARGLTIYEQVVRWEEPRAMDYRVVRGAPLRNHLGEIRLEPQDGGTLLDYRIRFDVPWYLGGPILGPLLVRMLRAEISAGLARMAASLR